MQHIAVCKKAESREGEHDINLPVMPKSTEQGTLRYISSLDHLSKFYLLVFYVCSVMTTSLE